MTNWYEYLQKMENGFCFRRLFDFSDNTNIFFLKNETSDDEFDLHHQTGKALMRRLDKLVVARLATKILYHPSLQIEVVEYNLITPVVWKNVWEII